MAAAFAKPHDLVFERLASDPRPDAERDMLVLAALDGREALAGYLDSHTEPSKPEQAATDTKPDREPLGAYLKAITVDGFRGIGRRKTLDLPPGPGLTLVVGRNGSGKSSFGDTLLGGLFEKKDGQRLFSAEQRRLLWNGEKKRTCNECGEELSWTNFQVDHLVAWSRGGSTKLSNAAMICRRCNASKGARRRARRQQR